MFPSIIRIWGKLRRPLVDEWERAHERNYFYAGKGCGAEVGAFKQASRAESANVAKAVHGMSMIDLVKCFDTVPHSVLVEEAAATGYNLWVLRLSLASYRSARTIGIGGIYSRLVRANRGITAGSAHATTELRTLLIRCLDRIDASFPDVKLTTFVDDTSAEATGTARSVTSSLKRATAELCSGFEALGMGISPTKCQVTASDMQVANEVARHLSAYNFRAVQRVKSLGIGLGAGTR